MKDLRERSPRVHCITNYVTAGDVANMVLAAGGSPVMAQGLHEVEDVTSICSSLVLNLGTLEEKTIPAMEAAGRKAAVLGLPVILDPVGATASRFRRQTAIDMIRKAAPSVIRGNEAEIRALNQELRGHEAGNTCGVDSGTFGTIESRLETACSLRDLTGAVVVMTGEEDVVAGKERRFIVRNGHPWMARITGSGCMLDGLMGAFCGLEALKGGATMVQLREKELDKGNFEEVLRTACAIRKITEKYNVPLIIDDNLELALACHADGLHVGQDDMEASEARRLLGPDRILGVTAKTVDQARAAQAAGADYLGSGAIFGTSTKADARPMTMETLNAICDSVDIPVVAIGGICLDNIGRLAGSHAAGAAIVSGIFGAPNIRETTEKLAEAMTEIAGLPRRDLRAGSV